ncbi:pre-mrna splicing factor [Neofusicoccum parvum]|nr:pre-mrna splicing factor [Neofusicoccum parvum]
MATPAPASELPQGVIRPPKELHDTIEKTAGYVARNGRAFIDRLRANHKSNPKFSFVFEDDAFWPFFQWRIDENKSGRGTAAGAGRVGEDGAPQPSKPSGPTEPPEFHFSARMPNINAQDLDVIKLTARFTAKNGRAFTTQLAQREASNSQFDFLRPQHSLNQFFNRLVEQYKELLSAEEEEARKAQLEVNVKNKFNMLEKAMARAEWVKYMEKQREKKEQEAESERVAYAEIDWHDFVVVETVLFTDADEQTDLPPPATLSDLQSASLEQKAAMSLRPHNMRIEEAMPDEDLSQWNQPSPAVQMPPPQVLPYQPQPQAAYSTDYGPQRTAQEEEEERLIRERQLERERAQQAQAAAKAGPPQMKIRSDYVPRAQAKRKATTQVPCPNCHQLIDVDDLEQHMRIELLDPQWKEQKAKADARYATSNLSTQDVANNLKRLASQRDDIFDPATGARITAEEEARRKRAATGYDGQPTNADAAQMAQMQGMNIQEQIRQIHQKFKQ